MLHCSLSYIWLMLHGLHFHFFISSHSCHLVWIPLTLFSVSFLCFLFFHHFVCMSTSLSSQRLHPVDVWSVGCIVAEMIRGSVLFPGTDRILPHHWLCHHFILCEEIQHHPESSSLPLYPFSSFPSDKCDLGHYPTAPTTVRTLSSQTRKGSSLDYIQEVLH